MPAAAVIPAPIAYIKVVAVKKLVVGFWASPYPLQMKFLFGVWWSFSRIYSSGCTLFFTLRKLECSKQA